MDADKAGKKVGSGLIMGAGDPQVNELDKLSLLGVELVRVLLSMRAAGGWAWLGQIAVAYWACLPWAITKIECMKMKRCKMSIPKQFANGLTEPLGENFVEVDQLVTN